MTNIKGLLDQFIVYCLTHIIREASEARDLITSYGHLTTSALDILPQAESYLLSILSSDRLGRVVSNVLEALCYL